MKRPTLYIALLATSLTFAFGDSFYTNNETAKEELAAYGDCGISFKLKQDITVTELSFYGLSLGGGDQPYVQLWNDDSDTLLASVAWSGGEAEAGWNSKKLAETVELKRGVTYQIQASAYWAPTYEEKGFQFHEVVQSTKFHQHSGWSDWSPPKTPSEGKLTKAAAAMANFSFEIDK